ncbi:DUF4954 family protein [bacterium]|nr:DUF4954 family protein [bacterium]
MLAVIEKLAERESFLDAETCHKDGAKYPDLFDEWPTPLDDGQIAQLKSQGNFCRDWSKVKISKSGDLSNIRNVSFHGHCLIGNLSGPSIPLMPGASMEPGLEDCSVEDVLIGDGCAIRNVTMMSRVDVLRGALVYGCGLIAGGDLNCMGLDREIVFAPGSGGRQLPVFPEMTTDALEWLAVRMGDKDVQKKYRDICAKYRKRRSRNTVLISRHARLFGVKHVLRSAIGPYAFLLDAGGIEDCIITSSHEAPTNIGTGVILKQVTTQDGVTIESGAHCVNCHFAEFSWAKESARVSSSIIGPNSGVSGGECRSSFVGPFVAFHHQSLLIATFWPGGRGNVSYGANVGSNHSGKAPDQEHWAGEGVFYGLGASIKFPANYTEAPYSLIASGVTTLPQRVQYPFSLINTPTLNSPQLSPAFNEIMPGWVLNNSMYGLLRNMSKFRDRDRARWVKLETRALRPDMLPAIVEALERLRNPGDEPEGVLSTGETFYTEKQIPGLGKNFLRESSRQQGIFAYEFAVKLIIALNVFNKWQQLIGDKDDVFCSDELDALPHSIWRKIDNFAAGKTWGDALKASFPIYEHAVKLARNCRKTDTNRGQRIIPDYLAVHGTIDDDAFVKRLEDALKEIHDVISR